MQKNVVRGNHKRLNSRSVVGPVSLSVAVKPDISGMSLFSKERLRDLQGNYYDDIMPNPDPIIRKLGLIYESDFYDTIQSDDQVESCIESVADGVLSLEWELYQGNADNKIQESLMSWFNELDIETITEQIIETPLFGRVFLGLDWQFINNMFVPVKIDSYPLELFAYQIEDKVKMLPNAWLFSEDIPPYRVLNPRYKASLKNPYGKSILSKCYWLTFFKKNARQFWNVFSERYGMPWVISSVDFPMLKQLFPDADSAEATSRLNGLLNVMVQNAIITTPKGIDVKLESMTANNTTNFKLLEEAMNLAISRVLLGHSGSSLPTAGKLGNEDGAMDIRADKITTRKRIVTKTFKQLIRWWAEVNFATIPELPVFRFYEEDDINKALAEVIGILRNAGVMPLEALIKKEFGWEPGTDFKIVDITQQNAPPTVSAFFNELKPVAQAIADGELLKYELIEDEIKRLFPEAKKHEIENRIGLALNYSEELLKKGW